MEWGWCLVQENCRFDDYPIGVIFYRDTFFARHALLTHEVKTVLIIFTDALQRRIIMSEKKKLTNNVGAPVSDNQNVMTAGPRGPQSLKIS